MGFFDIFKRNKSKVFELPPHSDNMLVQAVSYSLSKVTLGDTLKVKKDWMVVLVAKDKALDIFSEGEHKLNLGVMPLITKTLKLDIGKKKKRRGNIVVELPKDFLCDIYFVNMKLFENRVWKTESIKYKNKKDITKFWVQGRFDVQVKNARDVIELFLIDWGFIRSDMALGKIDFLISEFLTEEISKIKGLSINEISKQDMFNRVLKPKIDKKFEKYGLSFSNVGIESVVFTKNAELAVIKNSDENDKSSDIETEKNQGILEIGDKIDEDGQAIDIQNDENKIEELSLSDEDKEEIKLSSKKEQNKEDAKPAFVGVRKHEGKKANEENLCNDTKEKNLDIISESLTVENEKSDVNIEENLKDSAKNKRESVQKKQESAKNSVFDNNVQQPNLSGRKRQSIKLCKYCGEIVKAKSNKCEHCGRELEETKKIRICPMCGAENDEGVLFCECGCYLPPKDL